VFAKLQHASPIRAHPRRPFHAFRRPTLLLFPQLLSPWNNIVHRPKPPNPFGIKSFRKHSGIIYLTNQRRSETIACLESAMNLTQIAKSYHDEDSARAFLEAHAGQMAKQAAPLWTCRRIHQTCRRLLASQRSPVRSPYRKGVWKCRSWPQAITVTVARSSRTAISR